MVPQTAVAATGMPALPAIIAKIMILIERVLDCFVNVNMIDPNACCNVAQFYGSTTECGEQLAATLSAMVANVLQLGVYIFGALGVAVQ